MTRYSTPPETPPQNGFTLTTENPQPEVESSNWESRMSKLVGFEDESSSSDAEGSEDSATPQESLFQPQEVQTKQPLSSNPFAKLGLVGAGTLAVVLVGGMFLSQLMSSNKKPKPIASPVQLQPTNQSSGEPLESQLDTLKTKLALTEQAESVKAAQQQLRIAKATPPVALQQPPVSSRDRDIQRDIPRPAPTVYVPRTVTVERIVKVPASQPLPSPQLPVVTPSPEPVVNKITPPPTPSPFTEWTKLAKLGSYGQVNATSQPNNTVAASEPPNNPAPPEEKTPQQQAPLVSQAQPKGDKSVAVGTSAKAVLATAIFGESTKSNGGGNNDTPDQKNVFVIRLKEALKSTDGKVALPANTEFLTEVASVSDQGLFQMNVVKLISHNNGNVTEQSLANNTILVRGTEGKPLIANKFPSQSSSIASMDAGVFVLSGIGKAAELINRPDTELVPYTVQGTANTNPDGQPSNATTGTTGLTTITKNKQNLAAAVLEGGTNSIVPQIAQRNQQAIAQMSSQQGNVWFLPAGTNIEIYVNQATQF